MIAALALVDGWSADRIAGSFDGGQYRPAPLEPQERGLAKALVGQALDHADQPRAVRLEFPAWLEPALEEALGDELEAEMAALMGAAATDLRANTLKATREEAIAALAREGVEGRPTPLSPHRHPGRWPAASRRPPLLQGRHDRGAGRRLPARRLADRCQARPDAWSISAPGQGARPWRWPRR